MLEVKRTTTGRREMWKEVFEANFPPYPGGVLAFFGGVQPLTDFSASYDLVIRHFVVRKTGKCLYKHSVHIWPYSPDGRDVPSEFRAAVNADAREDGTSQERTDAYIASVRFMRVETGDGQELLAVLGASPSHSSIYVHRADVYRFSDVRYVPRASSLSIQGLPMNVSVAEDIASEHAQRLVQGALRVAAQKQSTVVLSFESSGFAGESLPEPLRTEKDFAVLNIVMRDSQIRLRAAFRNCLDNAADITVSEALECLATAGESGLNTALCSAAVLSAKDLHGLGWQLVEPFYGEILASDMCSWVLAAAQFAFAAGIEDKAAALLIRATELGTHQLELLVTLHTLSSQIGDTDSAQDVLDRLCAWFPNDPVTKAKCLKSALSDRDFPTARNLAAEIGDDYLAAVCNMLSADKLPVRDFLETARGMGEEDRARRDLASEAYRKGRYGAAWCFLRACQPSEEVVCLQCHVLAHRILRRRGPSDSFANDLERIMLYVSQHPCELTPRLVLQRILEDDLEYYSAMTLLAVIMDKAATRLHATAMQAPPTTECRWVQDSDIRTEPDEQSFEILKEVFSRLPREGAVVLGMGALPEELPTEATHKTLFDWLCLLQNDDTWGTDENDQPRIPLTHAIMLLAKHLNDPTTDALAIRYSVMAQCVAGRPQKGRDMAETALMVLPSSQPTFRSWRLGFGWLCIAEAFQRSHNPIAELSSIVLCLLALGDDIPSMKGAKEVIRLCCRIGRDVCLFPLAMKYVQFERDIAQKYGVDVDAEYQLVQIEHSIRTTLCLATGTLDELEELARDGCEFLEAEHDRQPAPMLSSLAALFSHIQQRGGTVSPEHSEVFARYVERTPDGVRGLLLSQAQASPTAETLRNLARTVGDASSLADLSFQGRPLRIAAERAVSHSFETRDVPLFLLASGILTQPMLSMTLARAPSQGVDSNDLNEFLYRYVNTGITSQEQIEEAIVLAKSSPRTNRASFRSALELTSDSVVTVLSEGEIVTVLARDDNENLYALPMAHNGLGEVRCLSPEPWAPARYREWSQAYPYGYGDWLPVSGPFAQERTTPKNVRDSILGLSVDGWSPGTHNIVVPDSGLFGFPFNLLPCGDEYAGQLHRISCCPSLAWLAKVRKTSQDCDGRRMAWLGVPGKRDLTLDILDIRTKATLEGHGFSVLKTDRPENIRRASVVVAVAHGGVGRWGQFATVTADRKLYFTPSEFARFFSNCGCAVLLICSAGRSDQKQHTAETRSLVTELIESEVRAVIAPVWPLAIDVAEVWLPEFLHHFTSGETVAKAAFAAAREVEGRFPNPCAWAAMHVYGDGGAREHQRPGRVPC